MEAALGHPYEWGLIAVLGAGILIAGVRTKRGGSKEADSLKQIEKLLPHDFGRGDVSSYGHSMGFLGGVGGMGAKVGYGGGMGKLRKLCVR